MTDDMEVEVHNKLEKDGGKKMIYKLAHDRDEDNKDKKGGSETERRAALKVWKGYFKELLNRGGSNGELELPYHVEGKV